MNWVVVVVIVGKEEATSLSLSRWIPVYVTSHSTIICGGIMVKFYVCFRQPFQSPDYNSDYAITILRRQFPVEIVLAAVCVLEG